MSNEDKYFIEVKVIPGAKKQEVKVLLPNSLKLKVISKPEKNLANQEAINLLSQTFKIPKSQIILVKGKKSRCKTFCIKDVLPQYIKEKLTNI